MSNEFGRSEPVECTRFDVLGVPLDALDLDRAVIRVESWIANRTPSYAIFRDVHGLVHCRDDQSFADIHRNAGMVATDGMPLVWLVRAKAGSQAKRVYGPDFFRYFCHQTAQKGYRHYFYGSTPETIEKLVRSLREIDPDLVVAGTKSPPFRPLTADEDDADVREINATNPDAIWVGLGTPKQERWMAAHCGRVTAPAMLGVGAAFDFIAGTKLQAPRWMQRNGVEWLYRLVTEPRRLAGRYFSTVPRFVYLVLADRLRLAPKQR
jgi:N-acetylglucosaminyldiphosphoundecaprenol N-acetyl-beta-D-mannosaminyltransferase